MDLDAYILAGGKSVRFGRDKALFPIKGEHMASRIHRILSEVKFRSITVVGRNELIGLDDVTCIPDRIPDLGPLGAIHSICAQPTKSSFFAISFDMPFIQSEVILDFLNQAAPYENSALEIEGRPQPLFAKYSASIADDVGDLIAKDELSMRALLRRIDAHLIDATSLCDDPQYVFANINTQNDLNKWLKK